MTSEKLKQARQYEKENKNKVPSSERPLFHVTGPIGWINDPNGFSVYKDQYHLFFQYHPYSTFWGPMHWGHVKTKDFIRWEFLPTAIAPDTEYDEKGCFSGSAMELSDGRQILMYTGVKEGDFQQQCIAIGDGIDYEKCDLNPVIPTVQIPAGHHKIDFRDPKIFERDGTFYLVAGSRTADTSGAVVLYKSKDFTHWDYMGIVDKSGDEYGKMWECPDYFSLDGKQVILTSPQDMLPEGYKFHSGNGTIAVIGHGDGLVDFTREDVQPIDYGIDFYAPQTLLTKDGRRVMIAWMQSWDTCNCWHEDRNIYGQMTLPRNINIVDGKLVQNPVKEIEKYYANTIEYKEVLANGITRLEDIRGRVFDMTVCLKPGEDFIWFKLRLAQDQNFETLIKYDGTEGIIKVDRSKNASRRDMVSIREFEVSPENGKIKLRVVMDKNSIELFVNDGKQACSTMIYTPLSASDISFESYGKCSFDIAWHELKFD